MGLETEFCKEIETQTPRPRFPNHLCVVACRWSTGDACPLPAGRWAVGGL